MGLGKRAVLIVVILVLVVAGILKARRYGPAVIRVLKPYLVGPCAKPPYPCPPPDYSGLPGAW